VLRAWSSRFRALGIVLLVGVLILVAAWVSLPFVTSSKTEIITGRVIGHDGQPVAGAKVTGPAGEASSNEDGWFQIAAQSGPQWLTVTHETFLPRTRAAAPQKAVLFRLTPDDGETVTLHFAGDVMFGRRFYDPNEDGDMSDGLLQPNAGVQEHAALLTHVQPLLENAHVSIVNLETPLIPEPYFDPTRPRQARFHPTKDYAFASAPASAPALREAGVDVIGLANNHLYDALEEGLMSTFNALEQAGFEAGTEYYGAGMNELDAWRPAVVSVRGQSIAFLGCTSIPGEEHAISYVASDRAGKGGAAECDEARIRAAVAQAAESYDLVVFQVHGGYEYGRSPSLHVERLSRVAREAGASLIVNHHPHVVGGLDWDGTSLTAWTLGNFIFDQTVWPTFESYLLAVHVRHGEIVRAYTEPFIVEGYVPKGVVGGIADYIARGAAGRESGPFMIEDGAAEVDTQGTAVAATATIPAAGTPGSGSIMHLSDGWWVSDTPAGTVQPGRDLLYTGGFENETVDPESRAEYLWTLGTADKRHGSAYAFEGSGGVRLQRTADNTSDVLLSPLYRVLIAPESELSIVGMIRASNRAEVTLQLSWYPDTAGRSTSQTVEPVQVTPSGSWLPFRLDIAAPPGAIAVGLFLRLAPPERRMAYADVDNVRLIQWASDSAPASPLYDHVRIFDGLSLELRNEQLPGAEGWLGLEFLEPLFPRIEVSD
jgi:hypothetical protein